MVFVKAAQIDKEMLERNILHVQQESEAFFCEEEIKVFWSAVKWKKLKELWQQPQLGLDLSYLYAY